MKRTRERSYGIAAPCAIELQRAERAAARTRSTGGSKRDRMRIAPRTDRAIMTLKPEKQRKLIEAVANCMIQHADELVALDQAVGDGDHGLNMKRGFEAVLSDVDKTAALPTGEALKAVGMALVMKVGGASGPLYGTLFMALGKALPQDLTVAGITEAFAVAVDAVKARGKSDAGAKTMLDVLVPLLQVLRAGEDDLPKRLRLCASEAAALTV